MRKNRFIFGILIIITILTISFAIAEPSKDEAENCLKNKVEDKCSDLSLEQQIFSLLAISECKDEILDDAENNECWPDGDCDVKTTAQAIWALNNAGSNINDAEDWLLLQKQPPAEFIWYLQIDSTEPTTCTISYGSEHTIIIDEDKKINRGAGSCLTLDDAEYWLEIKSSCYDENFSISCDESFLTNLLYKKKTSSEIYIQGTANSASADGTTIERVNSFCFKEGNSCDYEASLWAAFVLDSLGNDVSSFTPYLISMAEDNKKYLPDSFLYLLGYQSYYDSLLSEYKTDYWEVSGERYYDTALALLALQNKNPSEKSNTLEWLSEVQGDDGCWNKGNIRDTAFILYALWPGDVTPVVNGNGEEPEQTCSELGGEICESDERCDEEEVEASDEYCCLGTCEKRETPTKSECETMGGICRPVGCHNDEDELGYECDYSTDVCCKKSEGNGKSYWYIWLLVFLIILVIIGIIFRNKLRPYWFRLKSKFGKGPKSGELYKPRPRFPPASMPQQRIPRRILPSVREPARRMPIKRPKVKAEKEISDVLKKLKEIGK